MRALTTTDCAGGAAAIIFAAGRTFIARVFAAGAFFLPVNQSKKPIYLAAAIYAAALAITILASLLAVLAVTTSATTTTNRNWSCRNLSQRTYTTRPTCQYIIS